MDRRQLSLLREEGKIMDHGHVIIGYELLETNNITNTGVSNVYFVSKSHGLLRLLLATAEDFCLWFIL